MEVYLAPFIFVAASSKLLVQSFTFTMLRCLNVLIENESALTHEQSVDVGEYEERYCSARVSVLSVGNCTNNT